ncbi:MAG: DegT/DnrJ/EryC1/StrS aminotransferase [Candidatus Tokpelaia sp. JSC161]|jgi:predicted dehydrogenase|nr:MAG: DegT/DnrJ/EryC1/StrS aminotransferase [Candidatus Tokpelaia sp. JSC161]
MFPRVAVLGCGDWGSNHIRTLKKLGVLVAISDVNSDRADGLAIEHSVEALSSDELFLSQEIDAVVLALPPQFHAENAMRALMMGKDVLVEKPVALSVEDAEREVKLAREKERVFMVGHLLRFHPVFEKLLDLVNSGELGEVRYIHSHRLGLGKFHKDSDALWDLAPHDISMILALSGCSPSDVHGEGAAIIDRFSDFAHLHMLFPNGLRSHLVASRLNPYRERRLTVIGTKAMAVFDDVKDWDQKLAIYRFSVWNENGLLAFTADEAQYLSVEEGLPLTRELEHFLHCIRTRDEPLTNGEEAIAVLGILTDGSVKDTRNIIS